MTIKYCFNYKQFNTQLKSIFNSIHKLIVCKKTSAFTLAETLIVMGIIGIVAALTIPNLNSSTNDMEKVTKFKKIYAQLNEAQSRAAAVYGPIEGWFTNVNCTNGASCTNGNKRYFDRITEFLKLQKSCRDSVGNCTADKNLFYMAGGRYSTTYNVSSKLPQVVIADGSAIININIYNSKCDNKTSYSGSDFYCGYMFIDIDGPNKGKNMLGLDLFSLAITKDGIIPHYSAQNVSTDISLCTYYGYGCAIWILEKGNMDYLKTPNKSSKANSVICPNNKTLTWDSPTCK